MERAMELQPERQRNTLQLKYCLLHFLFWFTTCSINGFTLAFLQTKGLSNTEIGITTGAASFASIVISPFLSALIERIHGMTVRKMTLMIYGYAFVTFLGMTFLKLPSIVIIISYILLSCLVLSVSTFLSAIFVDYISDGKIINFGIARGCGSVSYAIAAVILGWLCTRFSTDLLSIVFLISGLAFLLVLFSLPDPSGKHTQKKEETRHSLLQIMNNYRIFVLFVLAYGIAQSGSACIGVQTITIVRSFGSNLDAYGFALFFMALSEMPVMAAVPHLLKKISCEKLILVSIGCFLLRNGMICIAPNMGVLIFGLLLQGISYGLFTAVIAYYVAKNLKKEYNLQGQTIIFALSSCMSGIGNLMGGVLMDLGGLTVVKLYTGISSAVAVLLVSITYLYWSKNNKRTLGAEEKNIYASRWFRKKN